MESPNHYELLGVTPDATAAEIRTSYRRLIRIYHPDVAGAAGAAMTLRLNDAQAALLDPTLRARLDSRLGAHSRSAPAYAGRPDAGSASYSGSARSSYSADRPFARWTQPTPSTPRPSAIASNPTLVIAFAVAAAVIVVVSIIVLVFSYSGTVGLLSPRTIPAYLIAVAWLVGGLSNPPKIFVVVLGFGAAVWPLTALRVGPFASLADTVPSGIWMLLTVLAASVLVLRLAASRISPRRRAARRHSPQPR